MSDDRNLWVFLPPPLTRELEFRFLSDLVPYTCTVYQCFVVILVLTSL